MYFTVRSKVYWLALLIIAGIAVAAPQLSCAAERREGAASRSCRRLLSRPIRKNSHRMIDGMLAKVPPQPVTGAIVAVVAPHAGYQYSGPVAAYTYAALKGHKFARVVVIAPSHYVAFDFTSIYDGDAYSTPLGEVQVDKAFAKRLAEMAPGIQLSSRGHAPTSEGAEHALEVQLPWLQRTLGDFQLVPIVMGNQSYESSRELGVALSKLIEDGNTLIVASSDLSHYHPYDDAVKIDHKTLDALQSWDYFSMSRNFETRTWEACGGAPIVTTMIAAERLGANKAVLLKYANSGDTTGDHARVVGYSADLFLKAPRTESAEAQFSLTAREKSDLLALARKSVEFSVREQKQYEPEALASALLNQERGAFVTLHKAGALRGCIGYTAAVKPLFLTVRDTAMYAALQDSRFRPVTVSELPQLKYEISVLSPLRRVLDVQRSRSDATAC